MSAAAVARDRRSCDNCAVSRSRARGMRPSRRPLRFRSQPLVTSSSAAFLVLCNCGAKLLYQSPAPMLAAGACWCPRIVTCSVAKLSAQPSSPIVPLFVLRHSIVPCSHKQRRTCSAVAFASSVFEVRQLVLHEWNGLLEIFLSMCESSAPAPRSELPPRAAAAGRLCCCCCSAGRVARATFSTSITLSALKPSLSPTPSPPFLTCTAGSGASPPLGSREGPVGMTGGCRPASMPVCCRAPTPTPPPYRLRRVGFRRWATTWASGLGHCADMNSAPHTHTAAPVLGPRAATLGVEANPGPGGSSPGCRFGFGAFSSSPYTCLLYTSPSPRD